MLLIIFILLTCYYCLYLISLSSKWKGLCIDYSFSGSEGLSTSRANGVILVWKLADPRRASVSQWESEGRERAMPSQM